MRRIIAIVALAIALAAPSAGASSISVASQSPAFQQPVLFDVVVEPSRLDCYGYDHRACARVEVLCYQAGELVYGEAADLERAREDGIVLGAFSSLWVQRGGGPADCTVNLFYFDNGGKTQTYVQLATTTFEAAG